MKALVFDGGFHLFSDLLIGTVYKVENSHRTSCYLLLCKS